MMKYKLQDLIDMEHFQNLQDRLNNIYSFPSSIIDNEGNILTATAWQDICTQFHRKNKECEKLCIESDQYIKNHIHEANPAVSYRCPHGLVDNAMPIIINEIHYANFFTGQFFLEEPDIGFFRVQAKKYGFDEDSYLKAVKRVPIWTQEQLNNYIFFIKGLIAVIAESGMKKLKEIENRQLIEASEKKQRSILKSAMDGYWLTDTEGCLLEVNDAYCRMSGYREDELLTMHVPDFEAVEDPHLVADHMQKVISQGSDRFESKHRRKDGTVFQVEVSIQFRPEEGGQCVCFLRDITERKQAEQTLKHNHDLNERIMETSPSGIIRVDAIGKVIYANKRAETILGINLSKTKTRAYNDPTWKIVGFDGQPFPEESLPFNIVKNTGVPVFDVQHAIEWPDGNKIYLSINASPLFDNNGNFDGIVASVEDISEKFISEQKYQMLFNEMINGFALHEIIINDKGLPIDYRFLDVNPAFEKLTNLKKKYLVGKTVLEVMPKTEFSWIEKYGKVALTGKPILFENYSQEFDRYYQVTAFRPAQNQFACIFMDITKRQQAENNLRDREQKYKSLFDQSNDGIFLHDFKGIIIDTNLKANKMLGYEQGELSQLSLQILHPDSEAEVSRQAFEQTKSKGQFVFESKFIKKDGSIIDVDISSSIVDQKKGIVQGIVRDITERKKAEESLKESKEKYRILVENANDSILVAQDGVIKFLNQKTEELTGYLAAELKKMPFADLIHPDDKKIVIERYKRRIEGEKFASTYSFKIVHKSGFERTVNINSILIQWENKPATLNFLRDVTQQTKLETQLKQAQKMESIGTLAGGIAHDFNNIMGIILGNTELALDDVPKSHTAHSSLEEIKKASLRATNIVKQLLSFTRITDEKLLPIEIALVIKDAMKFLQATIPTTIDIMQDICVTDETILADPIQINQIMMNLCINASHTMEQTGGKLTITVENVLLDDNSAKDYPDLKRGKYVKLMVSDTGPGIDPKIIDRIFDPYFTTKGIGKGSGMGLAVVHGIVKSHSGAIKVDSTLGKGTQFSIFFPLTQGKAAVEAETIQEIPRGSETILFVDDEISIVNMVQRMFERLGYKVQTATTPQDALDRFALNPDHFDLVITDMTMPQMTGVKLSEKLMDVRPDIPIIICTGHSALVDEEKAKELGLAAYVMKPINIRGIAQTIRKVLDRK